MRLVLLVLYSLVTLAASECIDGLYGKCELGSGSPVCALHCVCTGLLHDYVPLTSHCALNGTFGSTGLAWVKANTYREGTTNVSFTINNHSVFSFSSDSLAQNSTPIAMSNSTILDATSAIQFLQTIPTAANFDFILGAMPCKLQSSGTWSALRLQGTLRWQLCPGMDRSLVQIDAFMQNMSLGPAAPWQLLAVGMTEPALAVKFHTRQCPKVNVAFRARLAIPGVPALPCPEMSDPLELTLSALPAPAVVYGVTQPVAAATINGTLCWNVSLVWGESPDPGGCDAVTYTLGIISLTDLAFSVKEVVIFISSNSSARRVWAPADVMLHRGEQYQFVVSARTAHGGHSRKVRL